MLTLGVGGLYAFKAPLEEAKKFQQEAARFASLGFGDKINTDAQKFALGMKTYGTSAVENLTLLSDAMAVFKDLGHAEIAAPILAKMKFANEALFGREGAASNERQFMDMLKVIELRRGLLSSTEFETQANFVQKIIAGSRGRVNASAMLQVIKRGGIPANQLSNEAFYLGLEPLVQEFGGFLTGTGLNAVYNNLIQARGSLTSERELFRLGLLDPKMVEFNTLGQLKKVRPGAFRGSEVFEKEGPLALLNKVLLPAFAAHGIVGEEAILRELGSILSNSRGSRLLASAYIQRQRIAMNVAANAKALDINQAAALGQNTPQGKMLQLTSKWHDVLRELGMAVLPIAIKAVEGLTHVLLGLINFAREFPTLSKGLAIGLGILMTLVAAGGVITLATAGFKALWLALTLGRGLAIGGTLMSVASGFTGLATSLTAIVPALGAIGTAALALGVAYGSYKLAGALGAGKVGSYVAGKISDFRDWLTGESDSIRSTPRRSNAAVPGGSMGQTVVHTQVNLDGRKVAEVVTKHQARSAGSPQTGISDFDGRQQLAPAGGVGGTGSW